jgi:hypothetical protein
MLGGSWERDGHPWCGRISLTCRVGTLPLKTAEDASSSGEIGLLWSIFHREEPPNSRFWLVVALAQKKEGGVVNKKLVLLNSQSTANQVANPGLLTNIRKAKNPVTIHCNTGSIYSTLEGEFGSVIVKHDSYSIANVLLLYEAKQRHQVTYDSKDQGGVFQVHTNEEIVEFKPSARGLYCHNVSDPESNIELMLVNTTRENFGGYTHRKVKRAREAQCIQGMIANPTEREFAGMVHEQLLTNRPCYRARRSQCQPKFWSDLVKLGEND